MSQPLRIACCGSSFGGKSTLAAALANELNLEAILESRPTRAARVLGYQAARDVQPVDMLAFQVQGLLEQIKAEAGLLARDGGCHYGPDYSGNYEFYRPGFVSDRTVLDFVAFFRTQADELTQRRFPEYSRIAKAHAADAYDLIIYMPAFTDRVAEDNGIRHLVGHTVVEAHLETLFKSFELEDRVMRLTTDGVANRLAEVLTELQARGLYTPTPELRSSRSPHVPL